MRVSLVPARKAGKPTIGDAAAPRGPGSMPEKIDFSKVSFLIVDANPLALDMVQDILKLLGAVTVRRAADSAKAIKALREDQIDVMITEWELEPMTGLELID